MFGGQFLGRLASDLEGIARKMGRLDGCGIEVVWEDVRTRLS